MKYLLSINELFTPNSNSNATIIESELNKHSMFYDAKIDILINNIPYRFKPRIKKFRDNGYYIYLEYSIINHQEFKSDKSKRDLAEFEFIVNKSMMIQVLNSLPIFLEEYKKLLLKENINPLISGFYYDCNDDKRKNIYEYYFKNRLGNRLKIIDKEGTLLIFVELKTPKLLENLYL